MKRRDIVRLAAALPTAILPVLARARDDWPTRTVRIVVPSAAGGAADFLARGFGRYVTQRTQQPVVVENRPGGAAVIGAMVVKDAPADGHTLLLSGMSTQAANAVLYTNLPYDPARDFAEIGMFGTFPMVGLARRGGPLGSIQDIVREAKAKPGRLTFGHHAASALVPVELLKARAGIDLNPVPYKNVTQIALDIGSGIIDLAFIDALSAAPALKGPHVVPIAVTSAKRFHALPDVPSVAESYPGYAMDGWLGLSAPAATPPDALAAVNRLLADALADPAIKAGLEQQNLTPTALSLAEQRDWVVADRKRWVEWLGVARITAQPL